MSEITDAQGIRIDYVSARGRGAPALVLHGAYSTRDEVMPVFGPILDRSRHARCLPRPSGDGRVGSVVCNDVRRGARRPRRAHRSRRSGAHASLVIGHSFGAYLARGVAARHPEQVAGLALVSPFVRDLEGAPHRVVEDDGAADDVDDDVRGDYVGYFQVRTAETRERFERIVRPVLGRYDGETVESIMSNDGLDPDPDAAPFGGPAAILAGRDDALVGWRAQRALVDLHPRGTFVIAADAGHALLHERPDLVRAVIDDWLDRVGDLTGS